ncbi:cystathionine beta-lyase [Methylophilaceae bacterium]|nr:cystathionine beta-lyase [Methylophilaceae bacterium]
MTTSRKNQGIRTTQTRLVQPELGPAPGFRSLASAVERASTVVFSDVASLRKRNWRNEEQYAYGLTGTPTTRRLARKLALLEGGKHCILLPSGLAAISLVMTSLLKAGDRILLPTNAYEPAVELARFFQSRFGIVLDFYDPLKMESVIITANTRLLWVETPGSISMELADLPALGKLARQHDVLIAIDATWAAGIALPVFELGADISIQALTKYQSGGSDVMMGSIVTRDLGLHQQLAETHMQFGMGVSPEDCNIVLRSLPHYKLRYQAQDVSARKIAAWLKQQPAIATVLHPALEGAPGNELWQRDFSGAASLFSIVFQPHIPQEKIDRFVDQLQLFHIGFSWGGSVSLALPFEMDKIRNAWPYRGGLVRLYIGLEDTGDLIDDLQQALSGLEE